MLDVFFTVDVEVWCDGWFDIDAKFAKAFRTYVYGETRRGDFGLPYTLRVLNEHGLTGVFFVEPLFATRFGLDALSEIVGLIREAGQEVQLHLHTEWVDESPTPLVEGITGKRQFLRMFSRQDQTALIAAGKQLLAAAGALSIDAFRAGSFGFNVDTLHALSANDIRFDSSYDPSTTGAASGFFVETVVTEPVAYCGVYEYPLTVFRAGRGRLRHVQLTACSYEEIEALLWQALDRGRSSFVILSHNFELLNAAHDQPDAIVLKRFHRLCSFLARNRNSFRVCGFRGLLPTDATQQAAPLVSTMWRTAGRMLEQAYRRRYG